MKASCGKHQILVFCREKTRAPACGRVSRGSEQANSGKSYPTGLPVSIVIEIAVYAGMVPSVHSRPSFEFDRREEIMVRRQLLSKLPQLFGLSLLGLGSARAQETAARKPLKIMMKSAWGSDDPTRASFPFAHGLALADAGHEVQIFLLGEATYLMRKATASAILPVGWPPLTELLEKVVAKHIPVFS